MMVKYGIENWNLMRKLPGASGEMRFIVKWFWNSEDFEGFRWCLLDAREQFVEVDVTADLNWVKSFEEFLGGKICVKKYLLGLEALFLHVPI